MTPLRSVTLPSVTGSSALVLTLEVCERDGLLINVSDETRGLLKFVRADEFFAGVIKIAEAWKAKATPAEKRAPAPEVCS